MLKNQKLKKDKPRRKKIKGDRLISKKFKEYNPKKRKLEGYKYRKMRMREE